MNDAVCDSSSPALTGGQSAHTEDFVLALPPVDEGAISTGLYELSKVLGTIYPEAQAHGLLGGQWGYGQDFANDVFEMFPYWWGDCECGADATEWEWEEENPHAHDERCPIVRPNFKHFASGIEVRWYKYIGRSMEVSDDVDAATWGRIMADCLASLSASSGGEG